MIALFVMLNNNWVVVDKRVLDVVDRLDGKSAPLTITGPLACAADRAPLSHDDTIYCSIDLHDSAPGIIDRIDTTRADLTIYFQNWPTRPLCVGIGSSCLTYVGGPGIRGVEDALLQRLTTTHAQCLSLASSFLKIRSLEIGALANSDVIVYLGDGRYARMYERAGAVRFDSVITYALGYDITNIELFAVYKQDAVWPEGVSILNEDVSLTATSYQEQNLYVRTAVYRKDDQAFVRHTVYRRTHWDSHDIALQSISEQRALIVKGQVVAGSYNRYDNERAAPYPLSEADMLKLAD